MNTNIHNPFEVLYRKLESMETTMKELKSELSGIKEKAPVNDIAGVRNEPATRFDAAKYLGVSVGTIDNLIKSNQLKPFRLGTSVRFTYKDLDKFIEKKKK